MRNRLGVRLKVYFGSNGRGRLEHCKISRIANKFPIS
jgi:hypothetical protein